MEQLLVFQNYHQCFVLRLIIIELLCLFFDDALMDCLQNVSCTHLCHSTLKSWCTAFLMSVACSFSSRQFCLSHPVKCIPPSVLFLFWVMEIKLDLAAMLSALNVKHIATKCSGKMILGDCNYKRNSLHLESVMWNTCLSASTCCIQFVVLFKLLGEILSCIPFHLVLELTSSYGDLLLFFSLVAKEMK